jgi:hypothetical protein
MNYKKLFLALPILFFACESEEEDPTLIGSWTVTAYDEYSGTTCSGTPEWTLDSMSAMFGDDLSLTMDFTADENTMIMSASLSADALCSMMTDGLGTLNGDSCGFAIGDYSVNMPLDEVCLEMGGTYANSSCAISDSESRSYSTEDDAITFTYAAGTDSAEVETGTWSISGDVLTMSVAGDSSCTNFTLSK